MISLFLLAVMSGAVAAIVGFGIGSILTPFLALGTATPLAVAAVALPHALATGMRLMALWRHVDWNVLKRFGFASAFGALAGALTQPLFGNRGLTLTLGALLILTAVASLSGFLRRAKLGRPGSLALGALSGAFGGLVGNQGGVRSGALLAFDLSPRAFVATATASAMLVDIGRTPVYLARSRNDLSPLAPEIAVMTAGVFFGTLIGQRALARLPRDTFAKVAAAAVGAIGIWLIVRAA